MALRKRNSGAESGREPFNGSKDSAGFLVYTQKKFFGWGVRIFMSDVISDRKKICKRHQTFEETKLNVF